MYRDSISVHDIVYMYSIVDMPSCLLTTKIVQQHIRARLLMRDVHLHVLLHIGACIGTCTCTLYMHTYHTC